MQPRLHGVLFCPFFRKIAFALEEKKIPFEEIPEKPHNPSQDVLKLDPLGMLPLLLHHKISYSTHGAIMEYLNEAYTETNLMGNTLPEKGEVRRLCAWVEDLLYHDAYVSLFYEKVWRHKLHPGTSMDVATMKEGRKALKLHLSYLEHLVERRRFLAGNFFSWADISAASVLSCLDYLGEIPWKNTRGAVEWYTKIKSRPAFRAFLRHKVPGLPAAPHYALLDFDY